MENLATEILHELKASTRRWFIAFVIMIALELITVVGFMWYISLPAEETITQYEQNMDNIQDSDDVRQLIIKDGEEDGENETESQ